MDVSVFDFVWLRSLILALFQTVDHLSPNFPRTTPFPRRPPETPNPRRRHADLGNGGTGLRPPATQAIVRGFITRGFSGSGRSLPSGRQADADLDRLSGRSLAAIRAIHPGLVVRGSHCRLPSSSHLGDFESNWCPEGLFPRRPHHVCDLPHLLRREGFRLLRARGTAWHFRPHPRLAARARLDLPAGHRSEPQRGSVRGDLSRSVDLVDYFIYQASWDPSRRSSLSMLPVLYSKRDRNGGRRMQHIMSMDATGVLSFSDNSFIVAELETRKDAVDLCMILSVSSKGRIRYDEWRVLKRLPVRNGDLLDLSCWSTHRVVPYRNHLVWVDYYKGMIFANMERPCSEPNLRYVPLPVDATKGIRDDWNYGRRCPDAYHNICITSSVIKFVTVNRQHNSSSVVPLHRCGSTFRISTWSFCKYADTWIEEATLDAEEFWTLDSEHCFPHVVPEFPVFNMKNPDAICFSLNEGSHTFGYSGKIWMVEVHMKKKLLLNATAYYEAPYLSRQITTKSARVLSQGSSFIASEMPHYLAPA
nr:uncharacterized protein LOC117834132 [Setaria viridis]XP_034569645.1 uncharacterized protein LOC117834132 [Setaria viridis]